MYQGFAMGLLAGTILYPSITETKTKKFTLWGIRVIALVLAIIAFALTTKNFSELLHTVPKDQADQ
jgi:hypothetical protein